MELNTPASQPMSQGKPMEKKLNANEMPDLHHDALHAFYLNDGRTVYNIKELAEALPGMPEDTFKTHVTKEKNDFANWIRDVFLLPQLAEKIRPILNKFALKQTLKTFIDFEDKQPETQRMASEQSSAQQSALQQSSQANQQVEQQQTKQQVKQETKQPIKQQAKQPGDWSGTPEQSAEQTADLLKAVERLKSMVSKAEQETAKPMTDDESAEVLRKVKDHDKKRYLSITESGTEDQAGLMKDRFLELKKRMSAVRKEGHDLFFSTLLLKRVEPQMKLFMASNDPKDLIKLTDMLDEIEKMFAEEAAEPILDVKKEVLDLVLEKAKEAESKKEKIQQATEQAAEKPATSAA